MLHSCLCATLFILTFPSFTSAFTCQDYADALAKSILFFEGQRSGKLPANQRVKWRADSALHDGYFANVSMFLFSVGCEFHNQRLKHFDGPKQSTNLRHLKKKKKTKTPSGLALYSQVDLVGGYYDAGDNVKFGLPMAFTTTMLAWSIIEFGDYMKSELANANAALRWSSDYLVKAATATPGTLYVQVGEPYSDHRCWERPEDMDTPRNVYKVSAQNPGSDVAAETAAALAAASIVFQGSDPSYSHMLLQTAMMVFDLANKYKGSYSDALGSVVCPFYCSYSGYNDELLWGAAWIHRASQDASYMSYIQSNGHMLGSEDDDFSFSWDDKRAGTKVLLSKNYIENKLNQFQLYKQHSDNYICSLIPGAPNSQARYTRGGLLYKQGQSNLQYVTTSSFLLLTYAKYLNSNVGYVSCGSSVVTAESLVAQAKKQVDYILGDNPMKMSYMVGFGDRYPTHVHHRGSSVPSVHDHPGRITCDAGHQYFGSGSANPNVHVGAIVGGPDSNDNYGDDRSDYSQSEPATYINAPFVGAAAFFSGQ